GLGQHTPSIGGQYGLAVTVRNDFLSKTTMEGNIQSKGPTFQRYSLDCRPVYWLCTINSIS
ncbi:hypothetical protein, partial [Paenibacillus alginolyticus]|uniref:hypothetical protein n=1 Tax=Paenibacillus alginolyticus TaxID=59839 RepID=UPI001C3F9CFC